MDRRLRAIAGWGLLAAATLAVIVVGADGQPPSPSSPPRHAAELELCPDRRIVSFDGRVLRDRGWVQFLLYAPGYEWLRDESAIETEVDLRQLQLALASLDWRLWDRLWAQGADVPGIRVDIAYGDRAWTPGEFLAPEEFLALEAQTIGFRHLLFPGSPYFDAVALRAGGPPCSLCPVFPLEQAVLRQRFVRRDGRSGYELRTGALPRPGTRVRLTIVLPPN